MPRFVPRQRKHKARDREKQCSDSGKVNDSNQLQLPAKRSRSDEGTTPPQQPKVSGKKQKRLDKYLATKIRKDEAFDLLKKLEAEKARREDTVVGLLSTKNLGKRSFEEYASDTRIKHDRTNVSQSSETDNESEDEFELAHRAAFEPLRNEEIHAVALHQPAVTGSGLKQPLEVDEKGIPIIKTRRKQKTTHVVQVPPVELSWDGFDTESDHEELDSPKPLPVRHGDYNLDDSNVPTGESGRSSAEDSTAESSAGSSDEEHDAGSITDTDASQGLPEPRLSGIKAWATQQINKSLGHIPSNVLDEAPAVKVTAKSPKPTVTEANIQGGESSLATTTRKAYSISIVRSPEIQEARMKLPIVAEEQKIMEAVHNSSVVIVWGATGSGKTTQLPQFLFEAGYGSKDGPTPGMIGITQPRRVAAVSMAQRVKAEMGEHGDKVSYQIRFESTTSAQTAVKFMTDGILVRELAQDLLLRRYSAIVIDEAHERSVNTDILIGMLSRIVPRRQEVSKQNADIKPLKLIMMSATLDLSDFQTDRLFKNLKPPIVQAEGRQYNVVTHFARTTRRDYLEEVVRKVSRGHRKLPPGGILVFLTGQNEIRSVLHRLDATVNHNTSSTNVPKTHISASQTPLETEDLEFGRYHEFSHDVAADDDVDIITNDDEEDLDFSNIQPLDTEAGFETSKAPSTAHLLPLYSQLPTSEQMRVFEPPPFGSRLIVLATNVAETSLTIPGIRYVFDCGRSKERVFDIETGVQSFEIDWISKASAEQRKGRAGRTGPGHCYRLYSSAVYERDFAQYADPEILRTPVESVVLQIKSFHFPGDVSNFPFPTPPSKDALNKSEKLLTNIGALSTTGSITDLGRSLTVYPLSPRLGKMLVRATNGDSLSSIIAIVAALAVGDIFIPESQVDMHVAGHVDGEHYGEEERRQDEAREKRKQEYGRARATLSRHSKTSDAIKLLTAVVLHSDTEAGGASSFCETMFLRSKAMREVQQLRGQLASLVRANHPERTDAANRRIKLDTSKNLNVIKENVTAGFIDQIAMRADLAPSPPAMPRKPRRAIDMPYLPLIPLKSGPAAELEEKAIYLHPSSVLARLGVHELPQYVVFSHLQQSQTALVGSDKVVKTRMFPLTSIDPAQLSELARDTPLIRYGKPVGQIREVAGMPRKRECWVVPELGARDGNIGWPLPARKVVQMQDLKRGWVVETFLT